MFQTCYTAAQGVADKRTEPSGDLVIVLMSRFGCHNHINPVSTIRRSATLLLNNTFLLLILQFIGGKMCYHLYQALNHDAIVEGEARAAAEAAWTASGCSEQWACQFAIGKLKMGAEDSEIVGLELATMCYSDNAEKRVINNVATLKHLVVYY